MTKRYTKTAVFDHPKIEFPVNYKQINRCPNCSAIWSKGDLAPGSILEVRCSKCLFYFVSATPNCEENV